MDKYEPHTTWCSLCRKQVPVAFGERSLCADCHKKYYGNVRTLSAMEQDILKKEDDIANLQTIINLMYDMQERIKAHNEEMKAIN